MKIYYQYATHVKFVGILEIIFQVLWTVVVFVVVAILAMGVGAISSVKSDNQTDFSSNTTHIEDTAVRDTQNAISGIMIIAFVVAILVLVLILQWWMVHLVFFGGHNVRLGKQDKLSVYMNNNDFKQKSKKSETLFRKCVLFMFLNEDAGRLTIWYIIQSVFAAFYVIAISHVLMFKLPWFYIIIGILPLAYRIYSIHVVRCHAAEINECINSLFISLKPNLKLSPTAQ